MPGMMDTVLNLGLNDDTVKGFIKRTNNERVGYDSYRRFVQMYSNVVLGISSDNFEHLLHEMKEDKGVEQDTDLSDKVGCSTVGYWFMLFKNSSLFLVLDNFSIKSSIASTLFNSFKTLRNIQILGNIPSLTGSSSWRVLERLISMAG